jgi:hypothetical protein
MIVIQNPKINLSQEQKLFLKACFLSQEGAVSAWRDYQQNFDLDHIDSAAYRLLPLLYRNLSVHYPDAPDMVKLKGIYRKTWYQNQLKLRTATEVLKCLESISVRAMLLNEAALVLGVLGDYGFRLIYDIHILVPATSALSAINCLTKAGWQTQRSISSASITFDSCVPLMSSSGERMVLHWRFLVGMPSELEQALIWGHASSVPLPDGFKVHIPMSCHQLLKHCIDPVGSNCSPALHWLADVMVGIEMLKTTSEWDTLVNLAQRSYYAVRLKSTLIAVNESIEDFLPAEAIHAFYGIPSSSVEKLEAFIDKSRKLSLLRNPMSKLTQYMRIATHTDVDNQTFGFMNYLQYVWSLKHSWQIPKYVASRLVRST